MGALDGLLRGEGRFSPREGVVPWAPLLALLVGSSLVYGAAMGCFGWRGAQATFSALKVPLLLAVSTLICLPNFFVVNTVLGLRADFAAACRAVVAAQATMGVALASLAPVILLVYVSTQHYRFVTVMNGVLFGLATAAGQVTLNRHYEDLVARDRRHHLGRLAWITLYVFVAIQSAWVLRPFIGAPGMPSQFLREDPWRNAYVEVFHDVFFLFR
ncbi:MAG: hypothetical protein HY812_15225 [Planctomycetes bacterium]|nr:hypothetical protein [Planctomycetota bacterium]